MPKKTKQDKILARLRRLQDSQVSSLETSDQQPKPTISLNLDAPINTKNMSTTSVSKSREDYSHVSNDLRKTVFFVVVAIIFEFALSLALRSRF